MASDSDSTPSTPKLKQEEPDLQPVDVGKEKSAKKDPDRPKKRNLVRWDDDLDKQVLLTLQWACNEVGVKIPWELVAQTMGNGISEGAIVQHLSKLRGKMVVAKMAVPPTLRRGTVAKEPSKIYASSNGKKLPPPVFAPTTPGQTKSKKQATPKSQATPKTKYAAKTKGKRRRSELDDSEEEDFDDFVEDSDEEYGTAKKNKKVRTSKLKVKETSNSTSKKSKAIKIELDATDAEEINQEILATFEDGGPASRTRHVKQDFTNLEPNLTDEEEDEEEQDDEEDLGDFKMPATYSPYMLKGERSVSPRTVKSKVAAWTQGVSPKMLSVGISSGVKGIDIVPAYQQATMSSGNGLMTPQPSRNASTTSYDASLLNTPFPSSFGENAGQILGHDGYAGISDGARDLFSPVNYNGVGSHLSTLDNGVTGHLSPFNDDVDDIDLGLGNDGFEVNVPLPSTGLGDTSGDIYQLDDSMFEQFTY